MTRSSPDGARTVTVWPTRTSITVPSTVVPPRSTTRSRGGGVVDGAGSGSRGAGGASGVAAHGGVMDDWACAAPATPTTLAATAITTCRIGATSLRAYVSTAAQQLRAVRRGSARVADGAHPWKPPGGLGVTSGSNEAAGGTNRRALAPRRVA
jgi:hypothetical protein